MFLDPPTPTAEVSLVSPQKGVTWAPDSFPLRGSTVSSRPAWAAWTRACPSYILPAAGSASPPGRRPKWRPALAQMADRVVFARRGGAWSQAPQPADRPDACLLPHTASHPDDYRGG